MKRNLVWIWLAMIVALPVASQTNETTKKTEYKVVSEVRNVASFETIDVSGRFLVMLYPGTKPEVTVVAADEYIADVETVVENGVLKINMLDLTDNKNVSIVDGLKTKYNDYLIRQPIEIHIAVTNVTKIFVNGVTTLETESMLKLQNLYININDASKANLNIEIDNGFMAALSGASKMDIYGKAENADISVSGASSFEGKDFKTHNAKMTLSGASRANIHVTESLDAELKGATKLVCSGSPKNIRQNASRGSSIVIK